MCFQNLTKLSLLHRHKPNGSFQLLCQYLQNMDAFLAQIELFHMLLTLAPEGIFVDQTKNVEIICKMHHFMGYRKEQLDVCLKIFFSNVSEYILCACIRKLQNNNTILLFLIYLFIIFTIKIELYHSSPYLYPPSPPLLPSIQPLPCHIVTLSQTDGNLFGIIIVTCVLVWIYMHTKCICIHVMYNTNII